MTDQSPLSESAAFRFVVLIGVVSLFSDMTYQGAHGNAGPFLGFLGASGAIVGTVAGGGELLNYLLRLFSGRWADRTRRPWALAFAGYAVNLLAVPCLALAGHWPAAAALLLLERMGKGLRTPVRDLMLSHAGDRVGRGRAFGLHEALDQTGAMLGPLLVAGTLAAGGTYHLSFAILAVPAVLALSVLAVTRRTFPHPERLAASAHDASTAAPLPPSFWIFLGGIALLGAGYADFALIGFHMVHSAGLSPAWAPAAFAVAMALQGVSSYVAGHLFDRWGVPTLALLAVPAGAFAPLVFLGSAPVMAAGVALWALGMGAQSTVMKAFVARIVVPQQRGSAYGVLNAGYGVAWFAGSALMGVLYDHSRVALCVFSISAQAAAVATLAAASAAARKPT